MLGKFFQVMNGALKPGGVFYCKGNIIDNDHKDKLNDLVKQWAFKDDREYPFFSYIEVELYFHCADENGYVDYHKARKIAKRWIEEGRISQEDYDLAKILISMSDDARFRGAVPEREIKEAIQGANFKSADWLVLDNDICENMPIIKMVK